ncbi:MAG: TAXI family TRAP transporter solute-binding subunit [Rhodospirillales bacterium]
MSIFKGIAAAAVAAAVAFGGPVSAQVFSIGSNPQGSNFYTIATAISKVATQKTGKQYRVAPYAGSSTYVPMIDKGELEFGIVNAGEIAFAYDGVELFNGTPYRNLRMAAILFPSLSGFGVRTDSDIRTIADLKGKRLATEYTAGRIFYYLAEATLAAGGASHKDVRGTPVPNFVEAIDAFIGGRIDAAYIPLNAAAGQKAMASIRGGWRYLQVGGDPAAAERMTKTYPNARPVKVSPGKDALGVVDDPSWLLAVDFCVLTGKHVPDDVVYELMKIVNTSQPDMAKVHPSLADFNPADMHGKHPVPYHPGAAKFYADNKM